MSLDTRRLRSAIRFIDGGLLLLVVLASAKGVSHFFHVEFLDLRESFDEVVIVLRQLVHIDSVDLTFALDLRLKGAPLEVLCQSLGQPALIRGHDTVPQVEGLMEAQEALRAGQDLDALILDELCDLDCRLDLILFVYFFDHEGGKYAVVVQILALDVPTGE